MQFQFDADISSATMTEDRDLIIEGTALDTSVNENNWSVPLSEFDPLIKQFNDRRQVRVDHSQHYRDIVGWTEGAYKEGSKIKFRARIHDPLVQRIIIKNPTAHHVSIGAKAKSITCSKCGKPSLPFKTCKCKESSNVVAGLGLRELSFITDPAYEKTDFIPLGFSASLTAAISSFAPTKEYKCELSPGEEKVCDLIKKYNPGTLWNLAAARELYPDYTSEFMKKVQRDEVAEATDNEYKSEKNMSQKDLRSEIAQTLKSILTQATEGDVKAHDQFPESPGGKNIPFRKDVPSHGGFEQGVMKHDSDQPTSEGESSTVYKTPGAAPGGKNIPFRNDVPGEGTFEQGVMKHDEDEAKKENLGGDYGGKGRKHGNINVQREDEDETKKETLGKDYGGKGRSHGNINVQREDDESKKEDDEAVKKKDSTSDGPSRTMTPGKEGGGGDAVMVISRQLEELGKKLEDAVKKFEQYHEEDETKKEDTAVGKLGKKIEEMTRKVEDLTKKEEVFHKKKEDEDEKKEDEDEKKEDDEAKKEDEDEAKKEDDESKKEASSKKKQIGAKVAPEQSNTIDSVNVLQAAWDELKANIKTKKPEWELPN